MFRYIQEHHDQNEPKHESESVWFELIRLVTAILRRKSCSIRSFSLLSVIPLIIGIIALILFYLFMIYLAISYSFIHCLLSLSNQALTKILANHFCKHSILISLTYLLILCTYSFVCSSVFIIYKFIQPFDCKIYFSGNKRL